jgi:acetyltransferase-like isoleucine patch superfamily enzyme
MDNHQCIMEDVVLGKEVFLSKFINLYGCKVGDRSKIGSFVEIQKGSNVGCDCKISSHSFICQGVTIKDRVFVGHNVTFTNDKYPTATNVDGTLKKDNEWLCIPTLVEEDVSIGSGTTVLCGITIGKGALIGAGSVVTQSVPPSQIWAGNPARLLKKK